MTYVGKALMLGDASVGKTSLLAQYVDDKFDIDYKQTIGANFLIKEVDLTSIITKLELQDEKLKNDIKDKGFKVYWWDVGGQQDKLFVTEYYFMQAVGAIIVFDILNKESYENLDFWISKMKELSGAIPFIIVGNKIDEKDKRVVSIKEGQKKAMSYNVEYVETSAKLNDNVDKAFEDLSIQILNNLK